MKAAQLERVSHQSRDREGAVSTFGRLSPLKNNVLAWERTHLACSECGNRAHSGEKAVAGRMCTLEACAPRLRNVHLEPGRSGSGGATHPGRFGSRGSMVLAFVIFWT